ncbi:MAG: tRNA (adenosine(37)-N6)-threonylcarbamoyltransferase complex transferase subunit TsaD [Rhodospirillaceae bacterium]|nr:tRNA (adenosine(37)-N6)-threonylcarbamoyltransferase complex transferase subunit TsaD [Rhodospirillaceae bacterium]
MFQVKILGIETSCDETGVAVYDPHGGIVAEGLYSQLDLHARFGGVVPELASRDHIAKLTPMIREVLADGGMELSDLDGIAYTAGPGLVGALMVGGSLATGLAMGLGKPVIPVHHMEAHLLAAMLEDDPPTFPFVALLVSGGHSLLVETRGLGEYAILGETLDDAAGEAFDKVARLLSLPYPGGPPLAALAEHGDPEAFRFPRPMLRKGLNFSFSGLKTAVRLALERSAGNGDTLSEQLRADVAASFQAAAVETLVEKCLRACDETGLDRLVIAGGVGANVQLRKQLKTRGGERGITVHYPRQSLCTDNGAMIALTGWHRRHEAAELPAIFARPRWPLDELRPPPVTAAELN